MNTQGAAYVISNLVSLIHDTPDYESLQDDGVAERDKAAVLGMYFNDLYKMFLSKLSRFESLPVITEIDVQKLRDILEDIIVVKGLLSGHK